MDKLMEIYAWISHQGALFFALYMASEAIGELPFFKSSSVFGAIKNALKWLKDKFPKYQG